MTALSRLRHAWRRSRDVGLAGLARRASEPLRVRERVRLAARFHARWATPPSDDMLLAAIEPGALARLRAAAPTGADAFDALRSGLGRDAFYADFADPTLRRAFAERHPEGTRAIVQQAECALRGDLRWVVPGGSADWHAALPNGGRWPLVPAHATGIEAEKPIGDVRLSWEVQRCTHLVRLAQAAWLTGEARFAEAAVGVLQDFAAANPPGLGVAWAHAQEAGIRAQAWLFAFHLLRDEPAFDRDAFRIWLAGVLAHADFVLGGLSDHVLTHNHLVSELAALSVLGLALPELRDAGGWRALGLRGLAREVCKQVDAEGVQSEGSTHYHAFVLDSLVATLLLARRRGVPFAEKARRRVAGMVDLVALLLDADGQIPAVGDSDAGRAFRLGSDPLDRRDLVAAAAVLFGRADWGAIAGDAPGAFWLTEGRAIPGAGSAPPPGSARRWCAAGLAVARSGFGPGPDGQAEECVVFRAGATALPVDVPVGHTHADALSLLWRVGGQHVLIDPGVYIYSEGEGWRPALRSSAAHTAVRIDRRDQADISSFRFGVPDLRPARWLSFTGDARYLAAAAEHPANGWPRVRRRVVWLAGGTLLWCDEVLGDGEHEIEGWLQLPASHGDAEGCEARLQLASGLDVHIRVFGAARRLELHRPRPEDGPGPGWSAPRYGLREPGTALRTDCGRRSLPAVWVTVLEARPTRRAGEPAAAESACRMQPDGSWRVQLGPRAITFTSDGGIAIEGLA